MKIVYCPTDEMVGDFNTKPLQGKAFYKHRDFIMNIQDDDPHKITSMDRRSVLRDEYNMESSDKNTQSISEDTVHTSEETNKYG